MESKTNKDTEIIQSISIIIPVYNEEKTILQLLEKITSVDFLNSFRVELIIIDDCSTDKTQTILESLEAAYQSFIIRTFRHEKNSGKGAAIQTGIAHANHQVVIIQDADLEYDPKEYESLLKPILENNADVVYGSRFMGGSAHRVLFFWHMVGNKMLTLLSNVLTDLNLSDMETCYKVFRSDILKSISLKEKRFGFEPEVTAKISRIKNIRIYEVGISYYGRSYEEGKKIGWKDGFRALYCILKYNIWSR